MNLRRTHRLSYGVRERSHAHGTPLTRRGLFEGGVNVSPRRGFRTAGAEALASYLAEYAEKWLLR